MADLSIDRVKRVVLFPGQGSQSVGMMQAYWHHAIIQETCLQANETLGFDVTRIMAEGPDDLLNQTEYTQLAMLVADVALWRFYRSVSEDVVDYVAGHSLGEFAALVASGSLDFAQALRIVSCRARLMQQAALVVPGAMAAIVGLSREAVLALCDATEGGVCLANENSAQQCVVSGHAAMVLLVMEAAKQAGAKLVVNLPVGVAAHSRLMAEAAPLFDEVLRQETLLPPAIPVIHNLTATMLEVGDIKPALVRHLTSPVLWWQSMQFLYAMGVRDFVECGPGQVLMGLLKRSGFEHQRLDSVGALAKK